MSCSLWETSSTRLRDAFYLCCVLITCRLLLTWVKMLFTLVYDALNAIWLLKCPVSVASGMVWTWWDLWFALLKRRYLSAVLFPAAHWREQKYTAHCHSECAFECSKHHIFTLLSAWSDDTNAILYGSVITVLFFIGTRSIIYHWQSSCGLMMHNSVGVVWHAAPAEGIWKVIRAINPKFFFFAVVCHDALQQPVVMMLPACSAPSPSLSLSLFVSHQKNNKTCLSCQLIRWNLIARPQSSKWATVLKSFFPITSTLSASSWVMGCR